MQFSATRGKRIGVWGIKGFPGFVHNARKESLEGYWRNIKDNRGILAVNSFIEPEGPIFSLKGHPVIGLAVIYDEHSNFAVVTEPSIGPVLKVHPRMPIIVTSPDLWLEKGTQDDPNPSDIIITGNAGPTPYRL